MNSNDTVGNGDKTSYILITDNVNNSTRVHEISPTSGNAFNVIHTQLFHIIKNYKSIKIIEQWSAVALKKLLYNKFLTSYFYLITSLKPPNYCTK